MAAQYPGKKPDGSTIYSEPFPRWQHNISEIIPRWQHNIMNQSPDGSTIIWTIPQMAAHLLWNNPQMAAQYSEIIPRWQHYILNHSPDGSTIFWNNPQMAAHLLWINAQMETHLLWISLDSPRSLENKKVFILKSCRGQKLVAYPAARTLWNPTLWKKSRNFKKNNIMMMIKFVYIFIHSFITQIWRIFSEYSVKL